MVILMGLFDRLIRKSAEKDFNFYDFGYFTASIPLFESENWQKEEGFDILPLDDIKVTKFVNNRLYEGRDGLGSNRMGPVKIEHYVEIKKIDSLHIYYIPFKSEQEMSEKKDVIEDYFNKTKIETDLISYYENKNILIVMQVSKGYTDIFFDNIKKSIQFK